MHDPYLRDLDRMERLIDQVDKRVSDSSMSIARATTRLERIGALVNALSMTSSKHGVVIDRVLEMEREKQARQAERERRRKIRREAVGLLQWAGAVLLFAATTLQIIGADTASGLGKLLKLP